MSSSMVSGLRNCQKEDWLLSPQCGVLVSWISSTPRNKLRSSPTLLVTSWHIPVSSTFPVGRIGFCLWCQLLCRLGLVYSIVSPVQRGTYWPAQSGFELLLSDQILWFGAWPGAALELTSISRDLWEASSRDQPEPRLLWDFPLVRPWCFVLEPPEDSESSVYPLVRILVALETFLSS